MRVLQAFERRAWGAALLAGLLVAPLPGGPAGAARLLRPLGPQWIPPGTDLGAAVNAGVKGCYSGRGPCTLQLPAGTFRFSDGIVIGPGVTLVGSFAGSTRLIFEGEGTAVSIEPDAAAPGGRTVLSDFSLAAATTGSWRGISLAGMGSGSESPEVVNLEVDRVTVSRFGVGLTLAGAPANVDLVEDSFESNGIGITAGDVPNSRVSVVILASFFSGSALAGISAGAGSWTLVGAYFSKNVKDVESGAGAHLTRIGPGSVGAGPACQGADSGDGAGGCDPVEPPRIGHGGRRPVHPVRPAVHGSPVALYHGPLGGRESTIYVDQIPGASTSGKGTAAACTASSVLVTLADAEDFEDHQGIALPGCGQAAFGGSSVAAPTPTVINWCGQDGRMACRAAPGSTTYNYRIVVDDGHEGYTAAGAGGTTTTGAATLGPGCCNDVGGANYLSWSAPAGIKTDAYGYFVYAQANGGAWRLIGLATIPGDAIPWAASTAYPNGSYVVPLASPNGSYYVAVTGGTSGAAEPVWCTSSATCTVADGSVTWQRQPFTWMDTGQTISYQPSWIPAAPPSLGSADVLVTAISGGGGSTLLSLADAASTSDSAAPAYHDDTAAVQAAVDEQAAACLSEQAESGAPYSGSCAPISISLGTYNVSNAINFGNYLNLNANEAGSVHGMEPFRPIFSSGAAQTVWISGLHTFGGKDAVFIDRAAADDSVYNLSIDARFTTDFAISVGTEEALDNGAAGISAIVSGNYSWDRAVMFFDGDYANVEPGTWVEPSYPNDEPYRAEFVNHGNLGIHGLVGVPFTLPYSRWVDNWNGNVVVDGNSRLGAEKGGIPAVYQLGGYGAEQAFDWALSSPGYGLPYSWEGSTVVVRDSAVSAGNYASSSFGVITLLNNSIPQGITLNNLRDLYSSNAVSTCSSAGAAACALPAGYAPTNLDTVFEGIMGKFGALRTRVAAFSGNPSSTQFCPGGFDANLYPFADCGASNAPPTTGVWGFDNKFVPNSEPSAGTPAAWLASSWGRAAPAWRANHTYTLATSPLGEGDDFVSATVSGTTYSFYVSAVGGGNTCTAGSTAPTWKTTFSFSTGAGATTTDGTCTWTLETYGSTSASTPGYVAPYSAVPAARFVPVGALGG